MWNFRNVIDQAFSNLGHPRLREYIKTVRKIGSNSFDLLWHIMIDIELSQSIDSLFFGFDIRLG